MTNEKEYLSSVNGCQHSCTTVLCLFDTLFIQETCISLSSFITAQKLESTTEAPHTALLQVWITRITKVPKSSFLSLSICLTFLPFSDQSGNPLNIIEVSKLKELPFHVESQVTSGQTINFKPSHCVCVLMWKRVPARFLLASLPLAFGSLWFYTVFANKDFFHLFFWKL